MKSYRVTGYYKTISQGKPHLENQYKPDLQEDKILDYETSDPLDEKKHKVTDRLIHRYKDRVLFLATDNCFLYCRHCFRRDFIDNKKNEFSEADVTDACSYINSNKDIHEILISGGDPLTISAEKLDYLLSKLRESRTNLIIRIGSRAPVVNPKIITDKLATVLGNYSPIYMAIQCNHSDELTKDAEIALNKLHRTGVNILNQAVLLKGINDNIHALKNLSHRLLECNVKPYYLFQGDLAKGTSHFRVPIDKGIDLVKKLRVEVSGVAMPIYAVDIPGGGGKIPINGDYIEKIDDEFYYLKNNEGFIGKYPREV